MGLKVEYGAITRLRREDSTHVQHCKVFSNWAVLIGPLDWEDHHLGKEGSERYRMHNLPLSCSCPGLYELGIASPRSVLDRRKCKIKCRDVIVVYLGQADNVRTRLQHYGRAGSHLERNSPLSLSQNWNVSFQQSKGSYDEHVKQGPGLFTGIFCKGFSIVFRWAAMNSKARAEESEFKLLKVFDYAWNRGGNGARRPDDVLLKLEKLTSQSMPRLLLQTLTEIQIQWMPWGKKVGIMIEGEKPKKTGKKITPTINFGAFSLTRNRPHSVSKGGENSNDNPGTNICGVIRGDGSICTHTPLKNRKRCTHHKAQKIININRSPAETDRKFEEYIVSVRNECGVCVADGSTCRNLPDKGRKRCNIHKAMRVSVQAQARELFSLNTTAMLVSEALD